MRINKLLSSAGVCSRRTADVLIAAGRVSVDGQVVKQPGAQVDPSADIIVDGQPVLLPTQSMIIALYKPLGVTTTLSDPHAETTITDLLPADLPRVVPAGRLDRDSEGLLILSNDGSLIHELTHPRFEHDKEYDVLVTQPITDAVLGQLQEGIALAEGLVRVVSARRLSAHRVRLVLHQGMKRQIRRMFQACGYHVVNLKRIRIGKLRLGSLKPGEWRQVQPADIF